MLRLVGGNLNYSSWTLRAWLALKYAGAEFRFHDVALNTTPGWKERILAFSGAGKVPVLVDGSLSIHESLAICEYVAELHPDSQLWPADRPLRARGRAIACEMLSSFSALRHEMPMNIRGRSLYTPSGPGLDTDIARVLDIWRASLESSSGPFLLGAFSIADCMFAPVATRFRTYGIPLPDFAAGYSQRLFDLPAIRELEAIALEQPVIDLEESALTRPR
jgi:glutathione S-transferase